MKKGASIRLGALAGAPALLLAWPGGSLRLGKLARALRTFATMRDKSNSLSAVLLGTNTDRRYTVLLHVVFWLASYWWFRQEGGWLSDSAHPRANLLMTAHAALTVFSTFYTVSYCLKRLRNNSRLVWLWVLLIGFIGFCGYCLSNYYLYRYIDATYSDMPIYFHRLTGNISKQGPWTFIMGNVFYYDATRFLVISFIPFTIKGVRGLTQSRLKTVALEKDNLKLELEFLRAQINPHFLFNTLNSVYSLIEDKDKTAASIVVSLSNMMRYALYDAATTEVDVAKELAFIQNYIEIQQIRHRRRLKVALEIAPDVGPQRIPPLLLINFVENAVKHGVDKLRHDAWLHIRAYRDELGTFCFAVANARPAQADADLREGIGTRNTRRRLDILYPGAYSLQTSHTATQFDILLRLWPPHNG